MTRYQVWKARERARFRHIAEQARVRKKYPKLHFLGQLSEEDYDRTANAAIAHITYRVIAKAHGISDPFTKW